MEGRKKLQPRDQSTDKRQEGLLSFGNALCHFFRHLIHKVAKVGHFRVFQQIHFPQAWSNFAKVHWSLQHIFFLKCNYYFQNHLCKIVLAFKREERQEHFVITIKLTLINDSATNITMKLIQLPTCQLTSEKLLFQGQSRDLTKYIASKLME